MKSVLLVGSGQTLLPSLSHASRWVKQGVSVKLITEHNAIYYPEMVAECVGGIYHDEEIQQSIAELTQNSGIEWIQDSITFINVAQKKLIGKSEVEYDYECVAFDVIPSYPELKTLEIPISSNEKIIELKTILVDRIQSGKQTQIHIFGGGLPGVELAFNLSKRFGSKMCQLTIIEKSDRLLPHFSKSVSNFVFNQLKEQGVEIELGRSFSELKTEKIVINACEPKGNELFRKSGLAVDTDGFIRVNTKLQSISSRDIFTAGNNSVVQEYEKSLKNRAFLKREGEILRDNIEASIFKKKLIYHGRKEFNLFKLVNFGTQIISTGSENGLYIHPKFWLAHPILLRMKHESDIRWIQKNKNKQEFKSFFERFHDEFPKNENPN